MNILGNPVRFVKHYKGDIYEILDDKVLDCTNIRQQDDNVAAHQVLYRRHGEPQLFTRDYYEFFAKLPDGTPRFEDYAFEDETT